VLISGDEEYRSEESLPQLGRSSQTGFHLHVLFAIDPKTARLTGNQEQHPGLER